MRFFRLWLPLGCLMMLFIACQQIDISTNRFNSNGHKHIQVIASGSGINPDGIWPPQPANMSNTGLLVGNFGLQNMNVRKASVKETIMSDRALLNVLGDNYLLLDVNVSETKNGSAIQEAILFSYSQNSTVRAWLNSASAFNAQRSVGFEVMAASDYQFPESKEEIAKSISLARAALVSQGYSDAQTLNAHSMLTYPDKASGEQFYDVRMLYVTLGKGNGAVPVYAAWVDLTNNIVTKSGLIESY